MKCTKCKSIEATIHVADVGDFCLDCHNDFMAELLGVSDGEIIENSCKKCYATNGL